MCIRDRVKQGDQEEPFEIDKVECIEEIDDVDFGYIEPDWGDEPYTYEW